MLPAYLRVYTAGAVQVRLLSRGVEVLQSLKLYPEAVHQLRALLAQTMYHPNTRGLWYDRLALNLDFHLKLPWQVRFGVRLLELLELGCWSC